MSGVFFDTNVLIYTLAQGDRRQPIALDLLTRGGTISVQVLNEFATVSRRKLGLSWAEVSQALAAIRRLCAPPTPLTVRTHEVGLQLADRYQLSLYDALITAAALEAGCVTLLSEDMHHGLVIDGQLTVHNPFLEA